LLLGTGWFLFAAGSALTVLASALYRAPEGHERHEGFHVRPGDRRAGLFRYIRPPQPARARK